MQKPKRAQSRSKRNRRQPAPSILKAIASDVAARIPNGELVVVGPAEEGDSTFLFVTDGARVHMTLGVDPQLIRSPRFRGEVEPRDREAEELFEAFRIAEAEDSFDASFRDLL